MGFKESVLLLMNICLLFVISVAWSRRTASRLMVFIFIFWAHNVKHLLATKENNNLSSFLRIIDHIQN